MALGGQVRSTELREWANRELRGYIGTDVEIPEYRKPGAIIQLDAFVPGGQITGQQISPRALPDFVQEHVGEYVPLGHGIGEIEAMVERANASGGSQKMSVPGSQEILAIMNREIDQPFQRIMSIYWSVSESALRGVVDQVKTTLVELVAEMRAGMPDDAKVPSPEIADRALSVAVHGKKARVNVTSAQASGGGSHNVQLIPEPEEKERRWAKVGAAAVGATTVIGVLIALADWQGWAF
jgi:hypothetical protein